LNGAAADRIGRPSFSVPAIICAMYQVCAFDTIWTDGSSATSAK
jgi:hypothetical protein